MLKEHSPIVSINSSMTVLWVGGGTRYGKMLNLVCDSANC